MNQLDIETITMEELFNYRKLITNQLKDNEKRYNQRFPNFPNDYGASLSSDYNGEGDDYSQLANLLLKINEELRKRDKMGSNTNK